MQQRLIAATIECLIERGYAGTSTLEVQQRAGVSRGALLHHFPSRDELIFAALRELMSARTEQIRQQMGGKLPDGAEGIRRAIDVIWMTFSGPLFQASLELWNAARTDEELRAALIPHERAIGQQIFEEVGEVFGADVRKHPDFPAVLTLIIQAMRGEAASGVLRSAGSKRDEQLLDTLSKAAIALLS